MSTLPKFIFLLVLACALKAQAKTYYLCIGIADYPGARNDLRLPAQDALAMQRIYQKKDNADGYCLINEQATSLAIANAFEHLCVKAKKEDHIVFFFSGHGGNGLLLAYDKTLSYKFLYDALSKTKASRKIIFIDACLSGNMRQSPNRYHPTEEQKNTDVLFFLSSRSNEASIEDRRLKNGYFTLYLERGMRGGADYDRNRIITARELFNFVSQGVQTISNRRQHPVMWGRFLDTMPIISW
jgi:hypothetical protein